jgi:hypothetical protein
MSIICCKSVYCKKGNESKINLKKIKSFIKKNDTSYEIYDNTKHEFVKPYFDLDVNDYDIGYEEIKENKDLFLEKAKKKISKMFVSDSLSISETIRPDKISYHIIVNDTKVNFNDYCKYMKQNKDYFKGLFIDFSVYKSYGKFRMIKCRKENQKEKMQPITFTNKKDIYKHFITNINDSMILLKLEIKEEKKPIVTKQNKMITSNNQYVICDEERLNYICNDLDVSRFDNYDSWRDVMLCVYYICHENKYDNKSKIIINQLSQKSKNYDYDKVNEFINKSLKYDINKPYGLDFLLNLLKKDNYDSYLLYSKGYDNTYTIVKKDFESEIFKVMQPVCFCKQEEDDLYMYNNKGISHAYQNKYSYKIVTDKKGVKSLLKTPFINQWLCDEDMRTYKKLNFYPNVSKCPKNEFNMFDGLRMEKSALKIDPKDIQENIKPILDHIFILTGKVQENADYFIKWLAQLVQKPGELLGISVVFVSKQGTGKNVLTDFIGKSILGKKYYHSTAKSDDVYGQFSEYLRNKILINLDEASSKDNFQNSDKLKNLITASEITYEKKYVPSIVINNYCRFIFSTNNPTAVKIEHSDRRFVIYKSNDELRNNKKYFNKLLKCTADEKVQKSFYDYLMSIDIENYDFINERPLTEIYRDMQEVNVPIEIKYLIDLYENNKLKKIKSKDLFSNFTNFRFDNGYETYKTNSNKFGRIMKNIKGVNKIRSNGIYYEFNIKELIKYFNKEYNYIEQEEVKYNFSESESDYESDNDNNYLDD